MEHDAWFFVGIFVFIFLIWIATGGPLHSISFTGPTLAEPQELGGGTYLSFPRASYGAGSTNISLPGSSNGESVQNNVQNTTGTSVLPPTGGSVFGLASPYQGLVMLNHYVSSASSTNPGNEYVEISVVQNASASVTLTGWMLESEATGNAEIIPKGTTVPTSGVVNAVQDIVLSPGENAIIVSGESPVGASFRENKCIGYFSTFQNFSPQLPQNCPSPSSELSSLYGTAYIHDPSCIDYADSLPRCHIALTQSANLSDTCQSFLITYLNYNGCVATHKNDADFNGTTWRIYLGRTDSMWRARHEIVKLLDNRGKTVDMFSY